MTEELIGKSWWEQMKEEFEEPYMVSLKEDLRKEYNTHKIYPKPTEIFKAFQLSSFEDTKVIILSQDPYAHDAAHGLAFSSQKAETPFSLKMILREVDRSIWKTKDLAEYRSKVTSNNLTPWAKQGVFLLNSHLTVRAGVPNSHEKLGWERFTKNVLERLWQDERPKVFVAWGNVAIQSLMASTTMDNNPHLILTAGHPAAAAHGKDLFSGNNHFLKINKYMEELGQAPIDWRIHEDSSN